MKTHLSYIMPVWKACEILEEPVVHRIGSSLLSLRRSASSSSPSNRIPSHSELDMEVLVRALFYRPEESKIVDPLEDPTGTMQAEPIVPPQIATAWNRWLNTKALQLDKSTLLLFLVPHVIQPSSGGHMGLFDCLIYAMQQGHHTISSTGYYGATTGNQKTSMWVPDVLILLAVCRQYKRQQILHPRDNTPQNQEESDVISDAAAEQSQKSIWTMTLLAYRIYDSYMKNGLVNRDTIHRFMTDIYGDDSYKKPNVKALLDVIFHIADDEPTPVSPLQVSVNEAQFGRRILDTMRPNGQHLLLDWIAILVESMTPTSGIPGSVTAYLETMSSTRPPLCQLYALADHRLYEIKRRFHSMVQQQQDNHNPHNASPLTVEQTDPITLETAGNSNTSFGIESGQFNNNNNNHSKVISEACFCHFATKSNEEMGSGGYLTTKLAKLVFRAGFITSSSSSVPGIMSTMNASMGWTLFHLLQFGCLAVRQDTIKKEDPDVQLLRFLFNMFQLNADHDQSSGDCYGNNIDFDEDEIDRRILTRQQIAIMMLRLMEYAHFRRRADKAPLDLDDSEIEKDIIVESDNIEDTEVNLGMAVQLGLVLPPEGSKASDVISIRFIVEETLKESATKDEMSFDEFSKWNQSIPESKKRFKGRLHLLMMELRLLASVQFGVPPTFASMEIALITEIERRHGSRHPQSEVSRRGPRGTVWNLIDAAWFKAWTTLIKRVAGTPEDALDGRDVPQNDRVRGLMRISNTGLLVENGSLSLRPDIRWKHDYELLPPLAWSALQAWYDGGPFIHRSVVKFIDNAAAASPHTVRDGRFPTENEIELYPYFVTVYLCDATSRGEARPFQQNFQLSRVNPILVMLVQLCKELDVDPKCARLWVMGSYGAGGRVEETHGEDWIMSKEVSIDDQLKRRGIPIDKGKFLLLELKDKETGKWPRGVDGKEWTVRDRSVVDKIPADVGDGIIGLYNMGNTCYLNTSIQCLSHTPILREYFTSNAYYTDINKTNPLGYEGRLAKVCAVLINELWKRSNPSVPHIQKRMTAPNSYSPLTNIPALTPKTFKESLGKFNDIFQGNEQHDAQELLAFLLGGLSEDLNRIVEKPYTDAPDSDGRPDHELADIWWSNHLKREMSIVVALFTGQYKSLLTCRTCKYESARFEPFMFLQLPLPEDEHLSVSLTFYPLKEGASPMRYCVRVRNDGNLNDVLIALAKILYRDEAAESENHKNSSGSSVQSISTNEEKEQEEEFLQRAKSLSIVVMREGYILKMAPGTWSLLDQQNKESGEIPPLFIYELGPLSPKIEESIPAATAEESIDEGEEASSKLPSTPVHIAIAQRRSELVSRDFLHPLAHRVFGTPLLIRIDNFDKVTGRALYDIVATRLKSVVPKSVLRFLSKQQQAPESSMNKDEIDMAEATGKVSRHDGATKTTTDMEEVAAGHTPRYGFRLRLTSRDGRKCLICPWYECCIGCLIPDDDLPTIIEDGDTIVVDWHFAVDVATNGFGLRVDIGDSILSNQHPPTRIRVPPVTIKNHVSYGGMGPKRGIQPGAVTLEECLDAFAKEEKIPEAYCSKCKDFRVQTKRMSLWRLPPVMIIHLKRFQFTQTMRRKLRELVVFPTEGLDLSRIMAPSLVPTDDVHKKVRGENDGVEVNEELKDDGRSEMLYDLYGVIHHQGALSGGHYVASIKSEIDGQWRLFNDAQIYDIHERDVVDPSAYILFYIRRDVAKAQLSDFWDVREGNVLSDEDMDQIMKGRSDRCVIS